MKYFFYLFLLCFTQHSALVLASSFSSKTYSEESIANIDHQLQYFIELERSSILETMAKAEAEGKALDINSLQIAYWQEVSDDCDQLSHILLRMGLHHGSFSAMKILNRLYYFNYPFVRDFFRGQIEHIHKETNIDKNQINIKINFLDRSKDRSYFASAHVDSIFEDQDPSYPFKWSLVFSNDLDADNTLFFINPKQNILKLQDIRSLRTAKNKESRHLDKEEKELIRRTFQCKAFKKVDNHHFSQRTIASPFCVNSVHCSPSGVDSRLPVHFYITNEPISL